MDRNKAVRGSTSFLGCFLGRAKEINHVDLSALTPLAVADNHNDVGKRRSSLGKRCTFSGGSRGHSRHEVFFDSNRYKRLRVLRQGRSATVFLGQNIETKEKVIFKAYRKSADATLIAQYHSEVESLWAVKGVSGVAQILEATEDDYNYNIIMEVCPGFTLIETVANNGGRIDAALAAHIVLELLSTLIKLHDIGYVYRNLKPEHVVVGPRGTVRLVDFSLAARKNTQSLNDRCGDVLYAAPEVLMKPCATDLDLLEVLKGGLSEDELPEYDEKVDVWSLGVVLFEALTGRQPFLAETIEEMTAELCGSFPQLHFPGDPEALWSGASATGTAPVPIAGAGARVFPAADSCFADRLPQYREVEAPLFLRRSKLPDDVQVLLAKMIAPNPKARCWPRQLLQDEWLQTQHRLHASLPGRRGSMEMGRPTDGDDVPCRHPRRSFGAQGPPRRSLSL